jgi:MmyB-like transcription regulator ligand binding domain
VKPGFGGGTAHRGVKSRGRCGADSVQIHTTGVKLIRHPVVGDLDLPYESFSLDADLSQSLLAYPAEPGSPSQDALTLLASWAATTGGAELANSQVRSGGGHLRLRTAG